MHSSLHFIFIFVNSFHIIGRPQENFATGIVTKGFQDIVFADYGPRLNAMRKIAHGALKMYGEGLSKLGDSVSVEIEKLFERFDEKNGQEFDPAADLGKVFIQSALSYANTCYSLPLNRTILMSL